MKKGHIFTITGPSGVGKSTIINILATRHPDFCQVPSYTTRSPRPDDEETKSRICISKVEFQKLIDNNELVDWIEYSNHLYGKRKKDIQKNIDEGKIVLVDTDVRGADPYRATFSDISLIFLQYEDVDNLKNRLRINRPDSSEEEIERRYQIALGEMAYQDKYDYVVTNVEGKPEIAIAKIEEIIKETLANHHSNQV